jgi:hypothetical protein
MWNPFPYRPLCESHTLQNTTQDIYVTFPRNSRCSKLEFRKRFSDQNFVCVSCLPLPTQKPNKAS